jgi:CDP-diacylglycerol---serine O-phosphatidyltransferase
VGKRIAPEMVLPVFVMVVLFFALLISYPWVVLTIGTVCYLASLPVGYLSYRHHQRKDAAGASAAASASASAHTRSHKEVPSLPPRQDDHPPDQDDHPPDRPARLN